MAYDGVHAMGRFGVCSFVAAVIFFRAGEFNVRQIVSPAAR